jgi:signal transduction histidine kinase
VGGRSDADAAAEVLVAADRDELRRAVANLVDNAVRSATSAVTLGVAREDGHVVLSVVDDGPGIPAADRARVFDRFTRLDEARDRDAGGSGLGLAIVRELVTRAGGTVELSAARSAQPPGLRAEIKLPEATADTVARTPAPT